MMYSLKRIIHNLKKHLWVYLLFVVEFAIGILILCSALNVLISLQKDLKAKQEEMASSNAINIITDAHLDSVSAKPTCMKQCMGVSLDVYLKLAEQYKEDFTFQYGVDMYWDEISVCNAEDKSCIEYLPMINVWFVNDEVFRDYFGVPMEQDTMYAGENAYKGLAKLKEYTEHQEQYLLDYRKDSVIWIENGEYTVAKKNVYNLEAMPPTEKGDIRASLPYYYFVRNEEDSPLPTLADCVFLPMSALSVYEEFYDDLAKERGIYKQPYGNLLKAQYKNSNVETEKISKMLTYLMKETHLTERNMTVEFTMDEEQLEQQRLAEDIKTGMSDYVIMSVSILFVVMLGTTGLFLIFLYRRKKQMAVSIAYGATKRRLFLELFFEVLLVTGAGTVIGLWALRFATDYFKTFYAETVFQNSCIVIALLAAFITAFFTSALAFAGVGEIAPAKILKDL